MITNITTELYTLLDYARYAASRFNAAQLYYGHGTDNAWDEACALVLQTLHLPPTLHPMVLQAHLTTSERAHVLNYIERRIIERLPVPYLVGEAWLGGLAFYVNTDVLIPRSPLAHLIDTQFAPWCDAIDIHTILDLGTGSGCCAVLLAMSFPNAQVDASDSCAGALAIARKNIARYAQEKRITLCHADVFAQLPHKRYDLIVSNPPYVSQAEMATLPPEYQHEPVLALAGGTDGLEIIRRILQQALSFLTPDGLLVVEVGNSAPALLNAFPQVEFAWPSGETGEEMGVFLLTAKQLQQHQALFAST